MAILKDRNVEMRRSRDELRKKKQEEEEEKLYLRSRGLINDLNSLTSQNAQNCAFNLPDFNFRREKKNRRLNRSELFFKDAFKVVDKIR